MERAASCCLLSASVIWRQNFGISCKHFCLALGTAQPSSALHWRSFSRDTALCCGPTASDFAHHAAGMFRQLFRSLRSPFSFLSFAFAFCGVALEALGLNSLFLHLAEQCRVSTLRNLLCTVFANARRLCLLGGVLLGFTVGFLAGAFAYALSPNAGSSGPQTLENVPPSVEPSPFHPNFLWSAPSIGLSRIRMGCERRFLTLYVPHLELHVGISPTW